ncbi:MAG TPA: sulfatase [Candidatus Polarisedimenticolia bacterium]|nr:sulfatase [Candidatus Polarisedimenticolia bacterium]
MRRGRRAGRRAPSILDAAILLGFGLAAYGCAPRPTLPPPNILLVTVDTLRPDHLGAAGYPRATSPHIDGLALRGVRFSQAVTAAGRTVQSFPSILTGVIPPTHGLRYEGQSHELLAGRTTLTGVLRKAGYDTFAVTQGLNVGLHRDFAIYDPDIYLDPQGNKVRVPTRNDREASAKALQWLRGRRDHKEPFFLWLRYNAPHWPYDPPAPYAEMFDPDYHGAHTFNEEARPGVERGDIIFGKTRLPAREVEHAVAHYDGEVAYADAALGDLLAGIEGLGAFGRTIVLVTADHGESLGEHDYFFEHGAYLYEPTVRVPLIITAPGRLPEGRTVASLARTIDIAPTLIDLAGLPIPKEMEGRSLVRRARGEEDGPAPPAYSESGRNFYRENPRQYVEGIAGKWRMMRDDRYKLLMIPKEPAPEWELYDLAEDPGETKNVVATLPAETERLKAVLMRIVAADPGRDDRGEPPLPEGLEEELRSLGYVGGKPR